MPQQSTPQVHESTSDSDSSGGILAGGQSNTRLNTINIHSNLLLRNRDEEMEQHMGAPGGERGGDNNRRTNRHPNRYSSVYGNELHISNQTIPIQLRNIDRGQMMMQTGDNDLFDEDFDDDYEEDVDGNVEDSFDERFDDNDEEDDDEGALAPGNLRSDIQSNERLLLSSARQNHTNTNTLILSDHDAVPLRRQNAIRIRPWLAGDERSLWPGHAHEGPQKLWQKEVEDLQFELFHTQNFFKYLKHYPRRSPIFSGHTKHQSTTLRSELLGDLIGNLDSVMDLFLQKRVSGKLWLSQDKKHTLCDKILSNKRKHVPEDMPAPMKKRKIVAPVKDQVTANTDPIKPSKRSKTKPGLSNLSYGQKHRIMDITYSSFLTAGSSFTLKYNFFNVSDPLDLVFSTVDYKSKTLQGVFSITPPTSKVEYLNEYTTHGSMIYSYHEFFLGINPETMSGPRDKLVMQQLKILRNLDNEDLCDYIPGGRKDMKKTLKPFTIPVTGKIIDFKNNDLRFLPCIKDTNNLPMRCLHLARTKSNRVRLQLLEWMKIQPFRQFEESFFLEQLNRANINLKDFKTQSPSVQKETMDLARGLHNSMFDLTKFFEFVTSSDIPIPLIENERFKRQMSFTEYKKTFFLQDWEKKLTDNLIKFSTCQDDCLLNIQLNYILFTLTIDICEFLNNHIEFRLNFASEEVRNKYKKQLNKTGHYTLTDSRKTVLLCSLDRKTGHIEIQNTRALVDYKNVYQFDRHANLRSNSANQDDGSLFHRFFNGLLNDSPPPEPFTDPGFPSDDSDGEREWEDPYHEALLDTVLKGHYKKTNKDDISFGGGNLSYGIV